MTPPVHEVRPYGRHALLVTPRTDTMPLALARAIDVARPSAVRDVVPAAETVLVTFDPAAAATDVAAVSRSLAALDAPEDDAEDDGDGAVVELAVVYDGDDIGAVSAATGLSSAEVVRRHSAVTYRVAFCGFAPGFAYLTGLDPALVLARRPTPRTSVPAGSVAVAGAYTAVYPTASPGGWHLLGRTAAVLWDERRAAPATLRPGRRVRFRPAPSPVAARPAAAPPTESAHGAIEVLSAGWSTSVQDAGRSGLAHLGVSPSGALDEPRRRALNRLLGNPADAAVLETAGGLVVRARRALVLADSTSGAVGTLAAGDELRVDPRPGELWATLAVRGGVAAPPLLGSRSWDSLAHIGPTPPASGARLDVGDDPRTPIDAVLAPPDVVPARIGLLAGPRRDWFGDDAWTALVTAPWRVSEAVSRVGVRLHGPPLERRGARRGSELAPEGLVRGAVQVPPDGQPVVMLADHPTTGGYPVIAVVEPRHLAALARVAPGGLVVFAPA